MTSPLHVLARAACDAVDSSPDSTPSPGPDDSSTGSPPRSWYSSTSGSDVVHFATLRYRDGSPDLDSPPQPLRPSHASNHAGNSSPSPTRRKSSKKHSPDAMLQIKYKQKMRAKRQLFMERAMRIKSLDNSPVNDHQLHVLRMVYDQITMYPPESWMVLIAIVIRRAFKQVKNWFSNERQKNKEGNSVRTETKEGDKVRLRPLALQPQWCPQWSDAFFEEVIMIYDYKVLMDLRANEPATC
ncbi:hypothetical protein D9611_005751 [Ephemerocybe angulata]|uniref:Homeobox domain-containing protein n=1 Tax=Ephemerocybe angulata TaxID=980116 RepID=A0A8H5BHJ3_9AGAR|nr:hypothetical protein D9611_005751 [Tulosesus angulatus]